MNKSKNFFSIIIPTLNEEKYLDRLLTSLTKQEEKEIEIVLVDGNSQDKTLTIAAYYQKIFRQKGVPFTILQTSKQNVSYQKNLGARKTKSKWLVFFDADVWFGKNYLTNIKKIIQNSPQLKLFTSWSRGDSRKPDDQLIVTFCNLAIEASIIIGKPIIPGFCFIVAREIFEKAGGFNEELKIAEDYELASRIYQLGFIPQIIKKPKITVSLRRYRKEGKIKVLTKYAKVALNVLIKGNNILKKEIIHYPMGGKAHEINPRTNN